MIQVFFPLLLSPLDPRGALTRVLVAALGAVLVQDQVDGRGVPCERDRDAIPRGRHRQDRRQAPPSATDGQLSSGQSRPIDNNGRVCGAWCLVLGAWCWRGGARGRHRQAPLTRIPLTAARCSAVLPKQSWQNAMLIAGPTCTREGDNKQTQTRLMVLLHVYGRCFGCLGREILSCVRSALDRTCRTRCEAGYTRARGRGCAEGWRQGRV